MDHELERVLAAVPGWAGEPVTAEPISGGITNRNYKVTVAGESYVVRLAGKDTELLGVDRDAERAAAEAAAAAGVAPAVFTYLPKHKSLITRFVRGSPIPQEDLEREDVLALVVRSIKAIHEGADQPSSFPVFRIVEEFAEVARSRGVQVPDGFELAQAGAELIEAAFAKAPLPLRPCHNDLLNANFLREGNHVWIVDYEYAGMGDLFFDLGNLSINNGLSEDAQEAVLRLYFAEVTPARTARLALMRIMSDFREAMWGVVQQGISTLDFDYVDYADRHFARLADSAADPRFERWLADAAEGF